MTQISTSGRGRLARRLRWLGAGALALSALSLSAPASAAQVACVPQAGYNTCVQVTYSGGNQTFVVPTGVTSVFIKAWGAGGGGPNTSYYMTQRGGGGGGFASGTLTVTAGSSLGVRVGLGGRVNDTGNPYGGGGAGGDGASISRGASGGGLSGVFASASYTQSNARLIAGAGGGSSPGADIGTPAGGGGGGLIGGSDGTSASGKGGTQSAGGAAGTGGTCNVRTATAGTALTGGRGASTNENQNEGGGGGGGGYYGGGGGICQGVAANGMGGGGSSFLAAALTGTSTVGGENSPANNTGGDAAATDDPHYVAGIGTGGGGDDSGGTGLVVLQYNVPAPVLTLSKTVGSATVTPGGTMTYTLSLTNNGTAATATTVTVRDLLPPGVIATAATRGATNITSVNCGTLPTAAGALLSCSVVLPTGGIPVGATRFFTLTATAPTLAGTVLTNYASTNTTGSGTPATDPGAACTSNATVSCDSVDVTVVPGPAAAAQSGLRVVTDNVLANGTAQDVLEAFVRDASGNPVGTGAVVNFAATPNVAFNGGGVGAAGSCTTTAASLCQVTATSTVAATYATTAVTLGGTALGGTFTASGNNYLPSPRPYKFAALPTTVTIRKISLNATGTFGFTGSNGIAAQSLTTVTAGTPVAGAAQTLTAQGVATTLTEDVPPANYALTGVSCTGLGAGGTATPDLPNRKLTLDAAATAPGSSIVCTFTNTYTPPFPRVRIVKTTTSGTGSNVFGFALSGLSAATDSITVVGVGTANGAANLTGTAGLEASIRESAPAGWPANPVSASCVDAASATPTATFGTLAGNQLTIPAARMVAGANISCTFVNSFGFSVSGRVFLDNGIGSGTANDGLVNGGEGGIAGVAVRLTNCAATGISTATTNGAGSYALDVPFGTAANAPLCVEQTNTASRLSTGASVGSVKLPSGSATASGGTTYTYTRGGTPDRIAFSWNGSGHAGLNFGDVEPNTLAADGAKSGLPGSTVSYSHTFIARTGGAVSFSISATVDTPAIGGWSGRIFADTGCTGALQPGAAQLYPSSGAPVAVTVVAGQNVCLVMQESIPATAANGNASRSTVQASFDFTNAGPALNASYTVLDITTASSSALDLKKEVRNVTQIGTYGVNNLAKSGETLEYRITYTNNGAAPIGNLTLNDTTPVYTSFVSSQEGSTPAGLGTCTKTTPANAAPAPAVACAAVQAVGGVGPLEWKFSGSLSPGASGAVLFRVVVN